MSKLRFPKKILRKRLETFQRKLASENIDAAMIRVQSSYTYFTGTKWLRPALLVDASEEPILFVARGEEDELLSRTWVTNYVSFTDGGDLMAKVSKIIRERKYRKIGLEYGVERDAYILFYEMFKRLNPHVKVVDISEIIANMRMIKDPYEIEASKKAGEIAKKVMEKITNILKPGMSETDIAAEAYYYAFKYGSEEPKIHVNIGPNPRVHAKPFRDIKVNENSIVTIVLGVDYDFYYVNMSRTIALKESGEVRRVMECVRSVYDLACKLTRAGVKPIAVMKELDRVYSEFKCIDYRVLGYIHGVGLQVEEKPITTIVPKHRFIMLKENMVVAFIHTPLMVKGVGQVKHEDTFIILRDGLEKAT